MMPEKISFENWRNSKTKWGSTVEKTKAGEEFDGVGFPDLNIVEPCGYCEQFQIVRFPVRPGSISCAPCPLSQQKICFHDENDGADTLFWQYVHEMDKPKDERDILRAISLAEGIRDFIDADKP